MELRFPGGAVVEAVVGDHVVRTDQPERSGGTGSAPSPFDLFLASLGTCAGYYAARFCRQRGIDERDLRMTLAAEREPESGRVAEVVVRLSLPGGFPEKYVPAIERAMDQCAVKRHLDDPPAVHSRAAVVEAARVR